ncbi:MAG: 16S rRNA (cytidine(1402)-2'-O)-methyltransferase [Lachnospiraceae bacterium]|nr:16S rRNA (cytidine(1402)-2'-O)-methyltransferase [Lachnospiraceae bacterium]
MSGTLYIVGTPIGNLEDMTFRAVRILKEADLIAAEDTRNSIKLLNHFDIHTKMTSYHDHNKEDKGLTLLDHLKNGENVALITDAGMPCISDPGEEIVRLCLTEGIPVVPVPGPTAFATAIAVSGQSTRRVSFESFLPKDKKERARVLSELKAETRSIIIYEAPHHLVSTLKELSEALGDRPVSVIRELTKKHEEILLSTLSDAAAHFEMNEPRGEFVLVIAGKSREESEAEARAKWEDLSLEDHMKIYLNDGMSEKDAMKAVAKDRGVSKRDIYNALL